MADALDMPLEQWTDADLRSLIGRLESQRLELKSYQLDLSTPGGKAEVAEEAAGMSTASGGFIIIGTNEGDELVDLPGIDVDSSLQDQLHNSLLDRVLPIAYISEPRAFPADDPGKAIIVIQVYPHPGRVPCATTKNGTFYIRSGSKCRPMAYDEVQRWFASATSTATTTAARATSLVDEVRGALNPAGAEYRPPPFGVAVVPTFETIDHGRSGRQLTDLVKAVAAAEEREWGTGPGSGSTHLGGWGPGKPSAEYISSSSGISVSEGQFWRMVVTHEGEVALAVDALGRLSLPGQPGEVAIETIEAVAARCLGLGIKIQRRLGTAGSSTTLFASGHLSGVSIPEVIPGVRGSPGKVLETPSRPVIGEEEARYTVDLPVWGTDADVAYRQIHLFAQRVYDASHGADLNLVAFDGVRRYVRTALK